MSCQRCSFRGNAFHQIAIGDNPIDIRLDNFMPGPVELRGEMRGGYCHPHALSEPLSERTCGGLDTRGQPILRMTRRLAIELTEVFDLLHREIVSCEVQQRIE